MLRFTNYFLPQRLTHDILQGICSGIVDTLRRWWWWSWLFLGFRFKLHILLGTFCCTTLDRRWWWWFRGSNIEFLLPISAAFK
jgi:hypothetical protein